MVGDELFIVVFVLFLRNQGRRRVFQRSDTNEFGIQRTQVSVQAMTLDIYRISRYYLVYWSIARTPRAYTISVEQCLHLMSGSAEHYLILVYFNLLLRCRLLKIANYCSTIRVYTAMSRHVFSSFYFFFLALRFLLFFTFCFLGYFFYFFSF